MTVALTTIDPAKIVTTYSEIPNPLILPNGEQVFGISEANWTSQNNVYSLVPVTPFVTPNGQQNVGTPTYFFDAANNVIETYATQTIPAPIIPTEVPTLAQLQAQMAVIQAQIAALVAANSPPA